MPELNEDAHAYVRRGLRQQYVEAEPSGGTGNNEGTVETEGTLGEPATMAWQDYLSVAGAPTFEAHQNAQTGFHAGGIDFWIGGPIDPHWSVLTNVAFDIEAGSVGIEQSYVQYNTSRSEHFVSLRAGQLLPFAVFFNGSGVAMPLSAPVVMETPSRDENPYSPSTLLRGVEVGAINTPKWNAYLGAGQPQLDGIEPSSHTDLYASAEYLLGEDGNSLTAFGYKGKIEGTPAAGVPSIDYDRVAFFVNAYVAHLKAVLGGLWGKDSPDVGKSLDSSGGVCSRTMRIPSQAIAPAARFSSAEASSITGWPPTARPGTSARKPAADADKSSGGRPLEAP
jgi:hypothetical protein